MSTLHDRFVDLAEEAPASPSPPGIWDDGRRKARRQRVGTAAVVAVTLVALTAVGGVGVHLSSTPPPVASRSGSAPALPSRIYEPSGWLPTSSGPPGPVSVVIPAHRSHWTSGYTWGLVGVSATSGRYAFLDLPDYGSEGPLSSDGQHLAYYTGTGPRHDQVLDGLAVYDTVTGRVVRWQPTLGRPLNVQNLAWTGSDALTFTMRAHGTRSSYFWRVGYGAPRPLMVHIGSLVGTAGTSGLYSVGRFRYRYLAVGSSSVANVRIEWPYRTLATPMAVSPSGRLVAAAHLTQRHSALLVGRVAQSGTRTKMRRVDAALQWPVIVGWADDRYLIVVAQASPQGYDAEGNDAARYALERVDVRTGSVDRISDVGSYWGTTVDYATGLLRTQTRDFPAPPDPMDPRLEVGLLAGTAVVGAVALVIRRRRVRA